jgi:hypothetical protein
VSQKTAALECEAQWRQAALEIGRQSSGATLQVLEAQGDDLDALRPWQVQDGASLERERDVARGDLLDDCPSARDLFGTGGTQEGHGHVQLLGSRCAPMRGVEAELIPEVVLKPDELVARCGFERQGDKCAQHAD